jgi:thioredoxin-dependent peroxiredoxin
MADWVREGEPVPDFTLPADDGSKMALSKLRGSPVVLYFYPRDDTPGCTAEACAFRDRKAELARLGAKIFGISTDDLDSHARFRQKFDLNFPLLADTEHKVAEQYGAWREKVRFGKTSMGVQRSTFLIDADGTIRRAWTNVKVEGHDEEVLEAVKGLAEREMDRKT